MTKRNRVSSVQMATESARWSVAEQDDTVVIVTRFGHEPVLVEHDGERWVCSACGPQSRKATVTCPHTMAATRNLPREVALAIGRRVASPAKTSPAKGLVKASREVKASIPRPESRKRANRLEARDNEYRRITAEVTVRQITDEDRARLAKRRRGKTIGD